MALASESSVRRGHPQESKNHSKLCYVAFDEPEIQSSDAGHREANKISL